MKSTVKQVIFARTQFSHKFTRSYRCKNESLTNFSCVKILVQINKHKKKSLVNTSTAISSQI